MSDEAPQPGNEVDEFAGIEPAPRGRSPLMALAVLALGGILLWHLRADVGYAFSSRLPDELGEARNIGPNALADNRFVSIKGQPDWRNSLYIEPKGEKTRQGFFRLLGTGTRIFVRAADTNGRASLADRWSGRLRRLGSLPWAASLERYYAEEVRAVRYLPLDLVRKSLHAASLTDRTGDAITLAPSTPVSVTSLFPDELLVTLSAEKFPAADDAKHELEKLGLTVVAPKKNPTGDFDFVISAPQAARAGVIDKLEKADVGYALHQEQATVEWGKLDAIAPQVTQVTVDAPIRIAADAWVLTEDETPAALWWAPVVAALLIAFMAFNVWYLARARRA
jgi:hypothetical protein